MVDGNASRMAREGGRMARERVSVSDREALDALGGLLEDLDSPDRGAPRALAAKADHRLDSIGSALESGLDGPVLAVADPAGNAPRLRHPSRRVTEEDTLDATVDDHSPTDRTIRRIRRRRSRPPVSRGAGCRARPRRPRAIAPSTGPAAQCRRWQPSARWRAGSTPGRLARGAGRLRSLTSCRCRRPRRKPAP